MFGHTIQLNFDRKGYAHKTCIGGFVTIMVQIAVFAYIYLNTKRMIFLEDDKNFTETGVANIAEKGAIKYKDMNILVYTAIRDQLKG